MPLTASGSSNHSGCVESFGSQSAVTVSAWLSMVRVAPGWMPSSAAAALWSAASVGALGQVPSTVTTSGVSWGLDHRMSRSFSSPASVWTGRGSETKVVRMVTGAGAKP